MPLYYIILYYFNNCTMDNLNAYWTFLKNYRYDILAKKNIMNKKKSGPGVFQN